MNKKVTLQEESIREIAEAFVLADLAARTPRESNPHIPMVKDELYKLALDNSAAGTFPHEGVLLRGGAGKFPARRTAVLLLTVPQLAMSAFPWYSNGMTIHIFRRFEDE